MSLPLPSSLTPSKVSSFKDCALAFRFSVIDNLPEAPMPWTFRGTLVHSALERLFKAVPAGRRDRAAGRAQLDEAWQDAQGTAEVEGLGLGEEGLGELREEAGNLVERYFDLEDPNTVDAVGVELPLEVEIGRVRLRGIIDRLDRDRDGGLVVTDYKTGSVPSEAVEQARLGGVHFYAFLCERALGERPARVQLLYLRKPLAIVATPSDQSIRALERRSAAVWAAIERACETEDFRPHPSALCGHCSFRPYCPAHGGDPGRAFAELAAGAATR